MSRRETGGTPSNAPSSGRQNEYFVPRDGIDREVITADICRYLGNDALVRPGIYVDPSSGKSIQGYYIVAYRNLTTAMIQDLKADSSRWEQERRSHSGAARYDSSHRVSGAGYPGSNAPGYSGSSAPGYGGSSAPGYNSSNNASVSTPSYQQYDNRTPGYNTTQYQEQPQAYSPQTMDSRYSTQGQAPASTSYNGQVYAGQSVDSTPYVNVGAHQRYAQQTGYDSQDTRMVDASSSRVYSSNSGYAAQGQQDPRAAYYSSPQVPGGVAYSPQPVDTFVGRGSNYPATSQADYGTSAPPVSYQYVTEAPSYEPKSTPPPRTVSSTGTQAQTGHSGSSHSRREHRERDSYSKSSSDRHHRRTQQ